MSHLDIDRKKRDIHRLWITRINAVISKRGVSYYYSRLIHNLYKRLLLLNHKILSQIAISIKNCLYMFSNLLSSILVDANQRWPSGFYASPDHSSKENKTERVTKFHTLSSFTTFQFPSSVVLFPKPLLNPPFLIDWKYQGKGVWWKRRKVKKCQNFTLFWPFLKKRLNLPIIKWRKQEKKKVE